MLFCARVRCVITAQSESHQPDTIAICRLYLQGHAEHHVQATQSHPMRQKTSSSRGNLRSWKTSLPEATSRSMPFWCWIKTVYRSIFPPRKAAADAKRFPVEPGVVGVCPKTKANIIETETHYTVEDSSTGCKIHIERAISKRDITREEAKLLIESRNLGPFDDFISKKTNNPFAASLYLRKNESVAYKFAKR